MASFAPIPDVPLEGLNAAEANLFRAMKENIEILCGQNAQASYHAITNDEITVAAQANPQIVPMTSLGLVAGTTYTNGANLAAQTGAITIVNAQSYLALLNDVQQLQNAVTYLTSVVNLLITQLRS